MFQRPTETPSSLNQRGTRGVTLVFGSGMPWLKVASPPIGSSVSPSLMPSVPTAASMKPSLT